MDHQKRFKTSPLAASVAIVVAAGLTGCGGSGDSSGSTSSGQQVQLSGLVAKGIIKDALVSVYGDEDGDGKYDSVPISQTSTDENGDYEVSLPAGYTGPVNIQITKGINGKMICDITAGCKNGTVAFGDSMELPQGFLLEAVDSVSNDSSTSKPVSVTSLTHMAAKYAKSRGADATAVKEANEKVAKLVGVSNLTGTRPINITDANALKDADSNARKLSVLSAALAKDALTSENGDITAALDDWANEFTANDGGLVANVSDPTTGISLEKLLNDAKTESDAVVAKAVELATTAGELTAEELTALESELTTAINADSASLATAITEAEEQTEGEVDAPITDSTPVLSSAAEVKDFVDGVRTWATLLSDEQQAALANEDMIFSQEADMVMNSLDAGGLLMSYYTQYLNLFDGFMFGDKVDAALVALHTDFNNFSLSIAALDTALVDAVDAAQTAGESSGTATATVNDTDVTLNFSIDADGKVGLTNLPLTISDGSGNSLVIRSGSLLVVEDDTTAELTKLSVGFDVTFTGVNGSSLVGNLSLLGQPQDSAFFGMSTDSQASFSGTVTLKDAGAAKLVADISPTGISLSNLDYSYTGTDGTFSFNGADTKLDFVGVWDISEEGTYSYWQPTYDPVDGTYLGDEEVVDTWVDEYNEIEVRGALKGTMSMTHAGNSMTMNIDSGFAEGLDSAKYGDLVSRMALRNAKISVTNADGNTLSLTSTHSTEDDSITFAHNAISFTDSVTGNGFNLTSASAKTLSEDLGYFIQGMEQMWDSRLPLQAQLTGLELTSTAKNTEGVDNDYKFSGEMSAKMLLKSGVASNLTYCDATNCYYDEYPIIEPYPAGVSLSGKFANLTAGNSMSASASFSAANAISALGNSLWWQVQADQIPMGSVVVEGDTFTSTIWDNTDGHLKDFSGTALTTTPVTTTGTLVSGGIQLATQTWTGDYMGYGTDYSRSATYTLSCTDDSTLETCAQSVTGVDGLNYSLGTERTLGEVFAMGYSRLNAYNSSTDEDQRIRYQVRRAVKQEDGTYELQGQKRLRVSMGNVKFYSNMAASVSFEPVFNNLPETATITLNGNMGNLTGYGDLQMEQTDTSGNVTSPASKALVSAILKYGSRELWLSTQLKANEETFTDSYTYFDGTQDITETYTYTDQFLEPVGGFIKVTNAAGTSLKIIPAEDDLGVVTGQLRAADGGLWGTVYLSDSGQLMVAYKDGAVEALTLANSSELIQEDQIDANTPSGSSTFCDLNPNDSSCTATTETPVEVVAEDTLQAASM